MMQKIRLCCIALLGLAVLAYLVFESRIYHLPKTPATDYIHLQVEGGWGNNHDIWIYPDDTYRGADYDDNTHKLFQKDRGFQKGLFASIVHSIDQENLWPVTRESLENDLSLASEKQEISHDATDQDTNILQVRASGKNLNISLYGLRLAADAYPGLKSLGDFLAISEEIKYAVGASKAAFVRRTAPTENGENPITTFSPDRLGELKEHGVSLSYYWKGSPGAKTSRIVFEGKFDYSDLAQGDYVEIFERESNPQGTYSRFMFTSEQAKDKRDDYEVDMAGAGIGENSIFIQRRSPSGDLKGGYVILLKDVVKSRELRGREIGG